MKWDARQYDSVKAPQIDAGRELLSLAAVRETDAVLDLGCGTGKLTQELARLARKGDVTGIDPSPEMLEEARRKGNSSGNISYKLIAAESMKFRDKFDLVYSNSALQWIKEQKMVIELVYRSLRDKGRIAFQMPTRNFCPIFFDCAQKAIDTLGLGAAYEGWATPWHFPSRDEFRKMLLDAGFRNMNVYHRDYDLVFASINDVLDWWASAGLRPFLARLDNEQGEYFKYAFAMNFEKNRTGRGIEFTFRRLFAFADK